MINRRNFLINVGGISLASGLAKAEWPDLQDNLFQKTGNRIVPESLIIPRAITKGDKIAITAAASPTSLWEISNFITFIKKMGCKPIIGDTALKWETKNRYFSASPQTRADEFMQFVRDPEISAIICARGGYGVMRILDLLDFSEIKQNPKIVLGYSDITALLIAINQLTGITTYHGPLANSSFGTLTANSFKKILFNSNTIKDLDFRNNEEYSWSLAETFIPGIATGRLTGGNLSMISSTLGTSFEIDTRDAILFIEEVFEEPYKIDRMLTQLSLSGKLSQCKGFIFGRFENISNQKPFFPGLQFSVRQILEQIIRPLNKPTIINYPIGHGGEILTLPIGIKTELLTVEKKLRFLESTVTKV